jgi:tetratricopeptide (TPR) repeat protein
MGLLLPAVLAQFGPLQSPSQAPQARSQEELDLYLEIYSSTDPRAAAALAARFVSTYPRSEFLGFAYQQQMLACQQLNDYDGVLRAGAKALELAPRNVTTLLTLATVIPNRVSGRPDASALLDHAESYARQVLGELEEMKIPQEVPLEEWETRKAGIQSECHEALGHVSLKRKDFATAIREFREATLDNSKPNGRQFLRLSSAYLLAGQTGEAEQAAERAVELSQGEIRKLAEQQLREIRAQNAR